jgi:hypothetical protein
MARWLFPAVSGLVIVVVAGLGLVVWTQSGDSAACDRAQLAQALRDGIQAADQQGKGTFSVERPAACTEQDLSDIVPEVTRSWHMMPGGKMMREAQHTEP